MALLFFDGFQDGLLMRKPEWDVVSGWGATLAGRDGSTNGAVSTSGGALRTITMPTAAATCIVGVAFDINNAAVLGNTQVPWLQFLRGATVELVFIFNGSGSIEVRRTSGTGTLLGTTSGHPPLTTAVWHQVQAKVVLGASSAGSVEIKLDGNTVLTLTGVTTAGTSGSVTAVGLGASSNTSTGYMWFDDLWICDTTDGTSTQGRANDDYLGDLKIATLLPSGAGDSTQWTPSTGTNFGAVDEVPPNTTDYVAASVAAKQDLYVTQDLPAGAAAVYGVRVGLYALKTDAGASSVKPAIKEGSTVTTQTAQPLSTTIAPYYGAPLYIKPSNSAVFSATDVNNMQIGIELA